MKLVFQIMLCFLGVMAAFLAVVGILAARILMPNGKIPGGPYREYMIQGLIYTGFMLPLTIIIGWALWISQSEKK